MDLVDTRKISLHYPLKR